MDAETYRNDVEHELHRLKGLAEKAVAQIDDDALFRTLDEESNSIAVVMKHMAGNMRSRWTDFLTTDGEKPDRHRDREFELYEDDTPEGLRRAWERGWELTLQAVSALDRHDLERSVTIRGEPHTIVQAVSRQLTHYAYHVGQIVWLARHLAGDEWKSLSVPRGMSDRIEVWKDGGSYAPGTVKPMGEERTLFDDESGEESP